MTRAPASDLRPVLVLQHTHEDGPSFLGTWLDRQGVPWSCRNAEAGDAYPDGLDGWRALAILGGEMSANDDLPHLRQAEALIREAVARGVPVIGHCLGGQLMARALGGRVQASPAPEIGWCDVRVLDGPQATAWFGDVTGWRAFQWHHDAFTLPPGATALATSDACPWQAFALGPHLAMQFHVEIDAEKLDRWSRAVDARWVAARDRHPASVRDGAAMRDEAAVSLAPQQRLAERLYARWLAAAAA